MIPRTTHYVLAKRWLAIALICILFWLTGSCRSSPNATIAPKHGRTVATEFSDDDSKNELLSIDKTKFIANPLIRGGMPVSSSRDDPFRETVMLLREDGTWCTGLLISATAVATAAHCLCDRKDVAPIKTVRFGISEADFIKHADIDFKRSQSLAECSQIVKPFPPTQQDLAVLFLTQNAPVQPLAIASTELVMRAKDMTIVGFGENDKGQGSGQLKRYAPKVKILANDCTEDSIANDYHCHSGWEMVLEGTDSGICSGDSGGPAYITDSQGRLYGAALASRYIGICGRTGNIYVRLDGNAGIWLRKIIPDFTTQESRADSVNQ
jgi:hypothetical protein